MEHNIPLKYKKLNAEAFEPYKGSVLAAGKSTSKTSLAQNLKF